MAEAVNLGMSIADGGGPSSAAAPHAEELASGVTAGVPAPSDSLSARSSMSVREMRIELNARGVAHEHCLEKTELAALLAQS